MSADLVHHFPPDVLEALVEAIPLLVRARKGIPIFFRGCGVDRDYLAGIEARMDLELSFGKYHATREILVYLNDRGEAGLGVRREVVKRVAGFEEFSVCYPDKRLSARGAVAAVAQLVNRKDSFTRMDLIREEEQRKHRQIMDAAVKAKNMKREKLAQIQGDLYRLFGEKNHQRRGKDLEGVLNRLFSSAGILIREAFVLANPDGPGAIEQIDGAVELDGRHYLVEMKWWDKPLGRAEVASHLVSVYSRADVGGIFISASSYLDSAVKEFETALAQRTVVLVELEEIVVLLQTEDSLPELLRAKVREAILTKRPLVRPLSGLG